MSNHKFHQHSTLLVLVGVVALLMTQPRPMVHAAQAPEPGALTITEVLFDPPNDLPGDANRDGVRHTTQDEFIELQNTTDEPLDLSGVWITDIAVEPAGGKGAFEIPQGTILPAHQALVLFGGGTPPGNCSDGQPNPHFGLSQVWVGTGRIGNGLGNTEDHIRILATDRSTLLAELAYDGSPAKDQSITLSPNGSGLYVEHKVFAGEHAFSPGLMHDRTPFNGIAVPPIFETAPIRQTVLSGSTLTCTVPAFDPEGETIQFRLDQLPDAATLEQDGDTGAAIFSFVTTNADQGKTFTGVLIAADAGGLENTLPIEIFVAPGWVSSFCLNEVLLDPGTETDANGDGIVDAQDDEFLEIVNSGTAPLDLSGLDLWDSLRLRHTFPQGSVLAPGQAMLLFGGGDEAGIKVPDGVLFQTASSGSLSLNNTGETVILRTVDGATLLTLKLVKGKAQKGESLVRSPELEGEFTPSTQVASAMASPGCRCDGVTPFSGDLAGGGDAWKIRRIRQADQKIILHVAQEEFTPLKVFSCPDAAPWGPVPEAEIERSFDSDLQTLLISLPLTEARACLYGVGL
ncbi:MAG: lamin tail domain-containing protein [Verrucomicrobiota bacterium]|jgi:hypothetical protein|nr:lamin tail domain-containing protein [Verrucomicrobiota bacterium]MDI9382990.1 lamin tail domain-containing protein [Verrucomicrobiota bacterium]